MPHSTTDDQDNVVPIPAADVYEPIADDDIDGLIEQITGRLLTQITDPAVRYKVAAGLRDRAPWIQAVSAAQIIAAGDYKAATEQLGVSRVYLDRLMRNHDQPTPRKRADLEESPAYRYGWLLGVYSLLADRCDRAGRRRRGGAADEYGKHEPNAFAAPSLLPAIARSAERWMHRLSPAERNVWRDRIREATADVPLDTLPAYLTIEQQSQVIIGQSMARNEARKARTRPVKEPAVTSFTSRDLRDQVVIATDASDGTYDVDAIVDEIVERHGAVPVDDLEHDEFWGIVAGHAIEA